LKGPVAIIGLRYFPRIEPGEDLGRAIVYAAAKQHVRIRASDVVVITQKVVSKAEGRFVSLREIKPSGRAKRLAGSMRKDPRHVEVILQETKRIVRCRGGHLIVQTHHGLVCANAGVDRSNVRGHDVVSLLPKDPDRSARRIRAQIKKITDTDVAVIVSDTFGRPWRVGQTNVAIGLSGMRAWADYRGARDMYGYRLTVTLMAIADELAGAAELVMGKSDGVPAAVIRGYSHRTARGSARQLVRPARQDLFR